MRSSETAASQKAVVKALSRTVTENHGFLREKLVGQIRQAEIVSLDEVLEACFRSRIR